MSSFFAALGIVFLAELGDKTQLVALGFGARYRLTTVLAGVAAGYMASMLLSVVIGGLLGAALPTDAISIGGGVLFVVFAILSLRAVRDASPGADVHADGSFDAPADGRSGVRADDGGVLVGVEGSDVDRSERHGAVRTRNTRVIASIAVAMFVAELGDKTMLATATLAAQGSPVLVWFGATNGIMLAGTVGVVIGRLLGDRLPERVILVGSSLLFLAFGIALIVSGVLGAT